MLRRMLILPILLAAAGTCGAEEAPAAGEPMASTAADSRPAAVAAADSRAQPDAASSSASADPKTTTKPADAGDKTLSGMSILGNQEAPKALVIVPWKSSRIGDSLGLAEGLDDSRAPVDKEVFMRELGYYEIRSNAK